MLVLITTTEATQEHLHSENDRKNNPRDKDPPSSIRCSPNER